MGTNGSLMSWSKLCNVAIVWFTLCGEPTRGPDSAFSSAVSTSCPPHLLFP